MRYQAFPLSPLAPLAIAAFSLLAASAPAQAQTSQVFIEKAQTWGGGNTLYMYGVPIKNAVGDPVTKYWDLQILLEATPDTARPNKATVVGVTPSPKMKKTEFVQGTYKTSSGTTCTLSGRAYEGRNEYKLNCGSFEGLWYTGPITGHPYEGPLRAAKLDLIPGSDEYSWGKEVIGYNVLGGCFFTHDLFGAYQTGDALTLVNYDNDNIEDCRVNFVKQP